MNCPVIINLPAAAIGQQMPAAADAPQSFAAVSSANNPPATGEFSDFSAVADIPSQSQPAGQTFSAALKRAMSDGSVSENDTMENTLNAAQLVLQSSDNNESAVFNIFEPFGQPQKTEPVDLAAENSADDTLTTAMSAIPAIPVIIAAPAEQVMPSSAIEEVLIPLDNNISKEPAVIKPDFATSIINEPEVQNIFGKQTQTINQNVKNVSAANESEPAAENIIQYNQVNGAKNAHLTLEAKITTAENTPIELPLEMAAVKAQHSANIRSPVSDTKERYTVANKNPGQRTIIPRPETNIENSSQPPIKENAAAKQMANGIYQKTNDIAGGSLKNKISGDLQTLPIQETTTAGSSEKISLSGAADLKTDIAEETSHISRQIADSIKSAAGTGENQITVRLHPEELGKVVIKVSGENSQINTVIEASNPQTRTQLQEAFGQVAKNLADAGIILRQFEVKPAEQASGGGSATMSSQNNQTGQFGQNGQNWSEQFFQSQTPVESGLYYRNLTFDVKNMPFEQDYAQNYFTARSVNMLA